MLIELPQGKGPGHWQRVLFNEFEDNPYWTAIVWCPDCGRTLGCQKHSIAENGQITPSLGHPVEYPACPWHTSPRLIGWSPVPPIPIHTVITACEKCGKQARQLGGWGTWNGGTGLVCPECFKSLYPKVKQ